MTDLTENELARIKYTARDIRDARLDEAERCALLCEELADIHERGAQKTREDGSYTVRAIWPLFKLVKIVKPGWERMAQCQEGAAHSLRTVASCIRKGYDPRKLPREAPAPPAEPEAWKPCPRCTDPMDCGSWQACKEHTQ